MIISRIYGKVAQRLRLPPILHVDHRGLTPFIRYRWLASRPKPLQQYHVSHACTLVRGRLIPGTPCFIRRGAPPPALAGGASGVFSLVLMRQFSLKIASTATASSTVGAKNNFGNK